jgi:hypothetical protein
VKATLRLQRGLLQALEALSKRARRPRLGAPDSVGPGRSRGLALAGFARSSAATPRLDGCAAFPLPQRAEPPRRRLSIGRLSIGRTESGLTCLLGRRGGSPPGQQPPPARRSWPCLSQAALGLTAPLWLAATLAASEGRRDPQAPLVQQGAPAASGLAPAAAEATLEAAPDSAQAEGQPRLPVESSRLRSLSGEEPPSERALEVEAGQAFEWWIEVGHPPGFAPVLVPERLDASGAPLDPEAGWALLACREFAPVSVLDAGVYRSRAVLTLAALAGGSRTTESGLERVPERRLPDLEVEFVPSLLPPASPSQSAAAELRPDYSTPVRPASAPPPAPRLVPGPNLSVRSLIAAGQSSPLPLLEAPRPARALSSAEAWRRAALIAVLCLAGAGLALRALLRPLAIAAPALPGPEPAQRLREMRAGLDARPGALPDRALFYELSALLRRGLAARCGAAAPGATDEEWLAQISARLEPGERTDLERLIKRLARAKYGPEASSPFAGRELVDAVAERLATAGEPRP